MKISKIIVLSLTMASTQALAFQAKDTAGSGVANQQLRTAEDDLISSFYSQHGLTPLGTCAAVPVAGCNCPFCSMLRSQKV
ncbi:hypothetical protein [Dryocola sp. BD613]|uniref:hypothetical protein n=1 Tax=Dryocola sp. BD613 TaxID=3133272 RepID=UPI003F50278D